MSISWSSKSVEPTLGSVMNAPDEGRGHASFSELRTSVAEIVRVLSVRRWMFFIPFCLVTTMAFITSLSVPRRYEAVTTFERRDDPVLMNLPRAGGVGPFEILRRTLVQDVTNPNLLESVAERLGLAEPRNLPRRDTPDPDRAAASARVLAAGISAGLKVSLRDKSPHLDVIEIKYATGDPDTMIAVLDEVRDNYIRMTQERITNHLRRTKEWFDCECQKKQRELDRLQEDLSAFQGEHRGLDPLDPGTGLIELASMRSDLGEMERRRRDLAIRLEGRTRLLAAAANTAEGALDVPQSAGRGSRARALAAELQEIIRELKDLKSTRGMTELHPRIVRLREERNRITLELERQEDRDATATTGSGTGLGGAIAGASAPLAGPWSTARSQAEADVMVLEQLLAENEAEIQKQHEAIRRFEMLRTSAVEHRKEYGDRQDEIERLSTDLALYRRYAGQVGRVLEADKSQRGVLFEKIKPASGSRIPVWPRVSTIVVLTLVAGLVSGAVMVLLGELFDRTVRTRRQISRVLGLNILESIDEIVTPGIRRRRLLRAVLVPIACTALAGFVLASGSLAYLSLEHRALYQRVMAAPRAALNGLVDRGGDRAGVVSRLATEQERCG